MANIETTSNNDSLYQKVEKSEYLDEYLKNILRKHIEDISVEREIENVWIIVEEIVIFLEQTQFKVEDINGIWIENNYIKIYSENWNKKSITYLHLSEDHKLSYIWDTEKVKENKSKIIENLNEFENLLNAIDYLFDQNGKWAFDFWYLDEKDILDAKWAKKFGVDLEWKSIKELQEMARLYSKSLHAERISIPETDIALDIRIQEQQKRYTNFIVWIWDKYEWWAKLFKKSKEEIQELVEFTVDSYGSDHEGLLRYLTETHEEIDKNNFQSTSVETSYKGFALELHKVIYSKLKADNASDDTIMHFAKIVTGRIWNIDNRLKATQEFSNNIVLFMFQRKWWVMDKINESGGLEIEDKEVWDTPPKSIVSNTIKKLDNIPLGAEVLLKDIWFWQVLQIPEGTDYQDLRLEEKIMISTLARVLAKLWDTPVTARAELSDLFMQVAEEANKTVVESLNEHFDDDWKPWLTPWGTIVEWKDAEDFGLSEIQTEVFNLYNDINGNGLFDLSDKTKWRLVTWAKFAAVITVWIAAGFALPVVLAAAWVASVSAVAVWATVWLTATVASMALNPKWYDSLNEMLISGWVELAVWTATWAIWWWLIGWFTKQFSHSSRLWTIVGDQSVWIMARIWNWWKTFLPHDRGLWRLILNGYWVEWAKFLSRWWATNTGILIWDLVVLWILTEVVRAKGMNEIFHNESIFEDEANNEIWKKSNNEEVIIPNTESIDTKTLPLVSELNSNNDSELIEKASIEMLPLITFKDSLENKPFKFSEFKADIDAVKSLQSFLSIEADGQFGQITYEAVKSFQSHNNDVEWNPLQIDWMPGNKTLWAIIETSRNYNLNS